MQQVPEVIEELLPNRPIETEVMPKHREPFGRHAVFAGPDFDRIARHHADRHEDQEDQRQEGGDREQDASEQEADHGMRTRLPRSEGAVEGGLDDGAVLNEGAHADACRLKPAMGDLVANGVMLDGQCIRTAASRLPI